MFLLRNLFDILHVFSCICVFIFKFVSTRKFVPNILKIGIRTVRPKCSFALHVFLPKKLLNGCIWNFYFVLKPGTFKLTMYLYRYIYFEAYETNLLHILLNLYKLKSLNVPLITQFIEFEATQIDFVTNLKYFIVKHNMSPRSFQRILMFLRAASIATTFRQNHLPPNRLRLRH